MSVVPQVSLRRKLFIDNISLKSIKSVKYKTTESYFYISVWYGRVDILGHWSDSKCT